MGQDLKLMVINTDISTRFSRFEKKHFPSFIFEAPDVRFFYWMNSIQVSKNQLLFNLFECVYFP